MHQAHAKGRAWRDEFGWQSKIMKINGNWDDALLEVHNGGNGSYQSWFQDLDCKVRSKVCLSHHYKIICMALNNLEKEVKQGSYIKEGGCIC